MKGSALRPISTPERLAYWYFRLNGFLTTENFIIHPDEGPKQRTDADLLAVRFSRRQEILANPMADDRRIMECGTHINVIIAEVKTRNCALNGPWTDPAAGNMLRVLGAIGCVDDQALNTASDQIYGRGRWSDKDTTVRLFAIGEKKNTGLSISADQQITWPDIIQFCIERFNAYRHEKTNLSQWPEDGRLLRRLALGEDAEQSIRQVFRLRNGANGRKKGAIQ